MVHPFSEMLALINSHEDNGKPEGFSILELLVAMGIGMVMITLLLHVTNQSSSQWQRRRESAEAFQAARAAFETMTQTLAQATLNTRYDYFNSSRRSQAEVAAAASDVMGALKAFEPDVYGRFSDLHFICGSDLIAGQHTHSVFLQAPLDFDGTLSDGEAPGQLNAVGFFVRYGDDSADRPKNVADIPLRNRYRLMKYYQPTRNLNVYTIAGGNIWFTKDLNDPSPRNIHLMAENVVVLCFTPSNPMGLPLGAKYDYNSRTGWSAGDQPREQHQMPAVMKVLMVVIDEKSAERHPGMGEDFASLFVDPVKYQDDLKTVEDELIRKGVNYQVFQTDVPIKASKWSL